MLSPPPPPNQPALPPPNPPSPNIIGTPHKTQSPKPKKNAQRPAFTSSRFPIIPKRFSSSWVFVSFVSSSSSSRLNSRRTVRTPSTYPRPSASIRVNFTDSLIPTRRRRIRQNRPIRRRRHLRLHLRLRPHLR